MVIATAPARRLGVESGARLRFGEAPAPRGGRGHRLLLVDEAPAFELSYWCGTCPFLFKRLPGAETKLSIAELERQLADGLDDLDQDVIDRFASLLPAGEYAALLLRIEPVLSIPGTTGDYFAAEQLATWGVDPFWGLPQYPQTPYYRTFETEVERLARLFEFVVPMVPPRWNHPPRVAQHADALATSERPTAVAVATLDVCCPAANDGGEWYEHWGLTHFLLDGHHKLQAAAETGRPLRLLSLLSQDAGLSDAAQVGRAIAARA